MTIAVTATTISNKFAQLRSEKNVILLKLESEEFAPIGGVGMDRLGSIAVSVFKIFVHYC